MFYVEKLNELRGGIESIGKKGNINTKIRITFDIKIMHKGWGPKLYTLLWVIGNHCVSIATNVLRNDQLAKTFLVQF